MPNIESFESKDAYIEYYRKYRKKNLEKTKEYKKQWIKKWRENNPEKQKELEKKYSQFYSWNTKVEVLRHYSREQEPYCSCCGESFIPLLCIDHINNDGAAHRKEMKTRRIYSWIIRNKYPDYFQVLCFNCNMCKHLLGECIHKM